MSYYGGGNETTLNDVFVKTAVEVKRFLPSLFNIKVVRAFEVTSSNFWIFNSISFNTDVIGIDS